MDQDYSSGRTSWFNETDLSELLTKSSTRVSIPISMHFTFDRLGRRPSWYNDRVNTVAAERLRRQQIELTKYTTAGDRMQTGRALNQATIWTSRFQFTQATCMEHCVDDRLQGAATSLNLFDLFSIWYQLYCGEDAVRQGERHAGPRPNDQRRVRDLTKGCLRPVESLRPNC